MRADILISVITRDVIHAATTQWLCEQPYMRYIICTPYTIQHQRNLQVERFLAGAWDWLFIVDNDVVPKAGTIERLLEQAGERKRTVMVAPPLTLDTENKVHPMAYTQGDDGLYHFIDTRQGKVKIDGTGMSGALLPRNLFEALRGVHSYAEPWFETTHDEDDGKLLQSEDFYFWERVRALGWQIVADLDLVADHIKPMRLGYL